MNEIEKLDVLMKEEIKATLSQMLLCFLLFYTGCYIDLFKVAMPHTYSLYLSTCAGSLLVCIIGVALVFYNNLFVKDIDKRIKILKQNIAVNLATCTVLGFFVFKIVTASETL